MSTYYCKLKKPWTSIRVERSVAHCYVTLWQNHGNAGTLTVDIAVRDDVVRGFFESEDALQLTSGLGEGQSLVHLPPRAVLPTIGLLPQPVGQRREARPHHLL